MHALVVSILLGALSPVASSTPGGVAATVAVRGDDREALVELDINGVAKGDIAAFVRGDAIVGVDAQTLERAGVAAAGAAGFERDARRYVDPATLGPRIRASYDPNQLVLALVIASAGVQRMDFSAPQPAADFAHPSASLDYDLLGIGGVERQLSLSGAVVAGRDQVVAQGVVGNANARPTAFVERDDPERRFEYEAGQFVTSADADLPSIFVAGVAAMRDFSLTPLQPAYPQPVYSGVADEPSVADVYVGGVLQRSVPVAPGPFTLGGIPDSTGSNVRIVLRDAQGVVRTIYGSGFLDIALLAAGTTDRSYAFGEDLDTGRTVLDGSYRLGISDRWTAGLHVRDEGGLLADALSSDVNLGSMQLHVGAIETGDTFGYDARASLVSGRSRISVGYADLAPSLAEETPVLPNRDLSIVAVRNMGHVDFSAELTREQQPGSAAAESIVANATATLPHGISGTLSLENDSSGGRSVAHRISLQFSGSRARPGANTVDAAYVGVSPQGETLDVRSSPTGLVGPHAELRLGQGYSLFDYGYASTEGVVDASLVQDGHGYSGSYELRGAVAVIDGHVKLARTLEDGFALVENARSQPHADLRERQIRRPYGRGRQFCSSAISNRISRR